jgi:hypothetical protein
MRGLLICGLLGLAACGGLDWRPRQIELAEQKIRAEVGYPSARFFNVQVTGDQSTGQICGQVEAATGRSARFIVYIDGTSGPYIEAGVSRDFLPQGRFDLAWRADCVGEGYRLQ